MALPATVVGAGLLALLVVVPTALVYTAYFRGLSRPDAAGTGVVVALLEPLTAAVLAAAVLDERLGAAGTVGALGLAAAVLRAAGAKRYRRAEQPVRPVSDRPSNRALGAEPGSPVERPVRRGCPRHR
jgi:DME family drug/metabolite transporter